MPRAPVGIRVKEATRGLGQCAACRAPLVWFETEAGKRMPFDVGYRIAASEVVQLTENGRGVIATISSEFSHWATCPAAAHFRRGRA